MELSLKKTLKYIINKVLITSHTFQTIENCDSFTTSTVPFSLCKIYLCHFSQFMFFRFFLLYKISVNLND